MKICTFPSFSLVKSALMLIMNCIFVNSPTPVVASKFLNTLPTKAIYESAVAPVALLLEKLGLIYHSL